MNARGLLVALLRGRHVAALIQKPRLLARMRIRADGLPIIVHLLHCHRRMTPFSLVET